MTELEQLFRKAWLDYGFSGCAPEHQYEIDGRKFDFAWPDQKVAVECHGFGFGHTTISKKAEDAEKIRSAQVLGWTVLVFTSACMSSEEKRERAAHTVMFFVGGAAR